MSALLFGITPTLSFVDNSTARAGLISTGSNPAKRIQKNCIECSRAHRRCVFDSIGEVECTRCLKLHLTCIFRFSGMMR